MLAIVLWGLPFLYLAVVNWNAFLVLCILLFGFVAVAVMFFLLVEVTDRLY